MHSTQKNMTALAASLMTVILLSGCGAQVSAPGGEEASSEKLPSTFYCYDTKGEAQEIWQTGENETNSVAAHVYVDAAADAVTDNLMKKLSCSREDAETLLSEGGLQIYLCMNPNLQALVDTACTEQSSTGDFTKSGQTMQSAAVLLDNTTGKILALSGGEFNSASPDTPNPVTQALHIPGSALVPLSVYAPALELGGLTPDSVERDQPDKNGWPVNPSGSYQDKMTVAEALRTSSRCVPVSILNQHLTPETSAQFLQDKFSLELVIDRTEGDITYTDVSPAALALGGLTDGVSPLDMAAAFSVFPRNGNYVAPTFYTKVLDKDGSVLLSGDTPPTRVLKESTASAMTDMLREVVANGVGTEARLDGVDAAGVPGISPAKKDMWFVGYTPNYTAVVWSGYASKEITFESSNPSAVLWKQVMQGASETFS